MANDPDRYAALDDKDWNMGPFYVLVDGNTGDVIGSGESGTVVLFRRPGPHFFSNAKLQNRAVRVATITLRGDPIHV